MKLVHETRKILGDATIGVNATVVRVPVFYGHSEAVNVETRDKLTVARARELLQAAPGVEVVDEPADGGYPTPVTHASGNDAVFVGRIREDLSRSEEHTSELQSLMRISYAVFCLKKKKKK